MQIIGRLGADAEVKNLEKATLVCFSVAANDGYGDYETTMWARCEKWLKPNDEAKIANFLTKGSQVYVEGVPVMDTYTNSDGETKSSLKLKVFSVELLGSKGSDNSTDIASDNPPSRQSQNSSGKKKSALEDEETDLPF